MADSLLDQLKGLVTPEIVARVGGALGESEEGVAKGFGAAIPALLSGLVSRTEDNQGAERILSLVNDSDNDGAVLSDAGSLLGDNITSTPLHGLGQTLLGGLFAGKTEDVADSIASETGLQKSSVGKILGFLAPLLLSVLGKNLGAGATLSSLTGLVGGQKEGILSSLTGGLAGKLGGLLGLGALGGLASGALGSVTGAASSVVGGLGNLATGAASTATGAVGGAVDLAKDAGGSVVDATKSVVGGASDLAGAGIDKAKEVAGDAVDAVKHVFGGAADLADGAVDKAKDAAGDAVDAAKNLAGGAADKAKDAGAAALGVAGAAGAAVLGVGAAAGGAVKNLAGGVGDAAEGTVDAVKDVAGKAVGAAGDAVGAVGDVAGKAAGAVGDAAGKAVGAAGDAVGAVGDVAGKAVGAVGDTAGKAFDAAGDAVGAVTGGLPKWLLPVAGIVALGAIAYFLSKGCAPATPPAGGDTTVSVGATPAPEASPEAASPAPEASPAPVAAGGMPEASSEVKLPDGTLLKAAPGGIEEQLVKFVEDAAKPVDKTTWFNFDRLLFDTSKASLKPESKDQIANTVATLKAFPKVSLKIGGYTDNTGNKDSNRKLSAARATTVLEALVAGGIEKSRLEAEGYGDQHPVADNGTEAGRAQNRRIAVRVTKK